MCLYRVLAKKPKKTGFGWKVVIPSDSGEFCPSIFNTGITYRLGEWQKRRTSYTIWTPPSSKLIQSYEVGFHIFLSRTRAETYQRAVSDEVLVRVEYRGARILGYGEDGRKDPQVIADEIRIVKVLKPRKRGTKA